MGKKVFNAKARQQSKTFIDNSSVKNIRIELDDAGAGYDEANALVLPSKKRGTKVKLEKKQNVKILTKKQRKHLEAIVDKKKKKESRASLLEALATVQIPAVELKQYTSISQAQTIGVKKLHSLDEIVAKKEKKKQEEEETTNTFRINSIKGAAKKRRLAGIFDAYETKAKKKDLNVIGIDATDSEDENEDDVDIEDEIDDGASDAHMKESAIEEGRREEKIQKEGTSKNEEATNRTLPEDCKIITTPAPLSRTTVYVPVHRDADIQAARLKLPILAEEQQVMETINENSIVIIAGETGSGKTTQIPQFLYESGYAQDGKLIGVTEPRRVAAIAMSKRVAREMNLSQREVSYLIRFEGNVTTDTRIKFMTDGVLLKEIESDFLLQKYSVVILDEAHERSAYTDILVGLLSRIVPLRLKRGNPLKLIIMSATLRVEDFTCNARLFKCPPPLLKVEARQYPVTVHFQKQTPANYLEEALKKTIKIHSKLPEGGILVFLTGQQEVNQLVRKLRRTFPYIHKANTTDNKVGEAGENIKDAVHVSDSKGDDSDVEFDMKRAIRNVKKSKKSFLTQIELPKINLDDYKLPTDDTEADLLEVNEDLEFGNALEGDDSEDEDDLLDVAGDSVVTKQPLWVLPLYSLLTTEKQNRIFEPPPEGCRLCIVSTNVAETSLTIPNIKYVVDSGRQKTRLYDKITGVSAFVVTYTSKASADQRAGRAGRVSAGHCYRLYSSAVYNDQFEDFGIPDIQKKPVDDLMLQMRCMGIDRVINFPFPSPPDTVQLQAAEQRLIILGALEKSQQVVGKELPPVITNLGRAISRFPVAPRFGKMLALSHQQNLLPYTVCLVAALSVQEVLMEVDFGKGNTEASLSRNKWTKRRQSWASTGNFQRLGDAMVLLRAVGAAEYAGSEGRLAQFCIENGLRLKAIIEVRKLRLQLSNEINLSISDINLCVDPAMQPPSDEQARFLRQILLAGMGDRLARKVPLAEINDKEEKRRLKYAYNCIDMEAPVFMHASSVLKQKTPDWVVYQEAFETQSGDTTKMFIRGITAIEPEWLLLYVPLLCNIRAIKEDPSPKYNPKDGKVYCLVDATFGRAGWEIPLAEVEMPLGEKACWYFGMFLLNGDVCPKLVDYKPKLKSTPTSLVKSWSSLNESVMKFKRALLAKQMNTRRKLFEEWKTNPSYLLAEYHNLLYDVTLAELTVFWPPINN